MNDEKIKFIFECILEDAAEVIKLPRNEFNDAKRLSYYEILNTIKNQMEIDDIDPNDYGLGFNLENIL